MANTTESDAAGASTVNSDLSLLDRIVVEGNMAVEPSQGVYAKKLIGQFASQILDEGMKTSPDKGVVAMINERVAEIDKLLWDILYDILYEIYLQ